MTTDPVHSESETHGWDINVADHPTRADSAEYVAARQKMNEIAAGAWLCTEASAVPTLESEPDHLWDEILRGMGLDPAMILPAKGIQ